MNFSEIIGQRSIIEQLGQFVTSARVPHAIFFDSKAGRGGLPLALAFASLLQCEEAKGMSSCGVCANCQKSNQLIHPDIHFAFPVVKAGKKRRDESYSNDFLGEWREQIKEEPYFDLQTWLIKIQAEKSAPNINVKECNEIIKKLGLKAFSGGKKVLILWLPEYLGKNGNRLLKLIEEPTDDTVLIFVSQDSSRILNTVKSRFQIVRIPPLKDEALQGYLEKTYEMSPKELSNAIRLSEGNLIAAKEIAVGIKSDLSDEVFKWLFRNYEFKIGEIAKWIDIFAGESKEYQKQFFRFISYIIRAVLKKNYINAAFDNIYEAENREYERLAEILTLDKAESLLYIANQSIDEIDRNINVKIMMMAASLQVSNILGEKKGVEIY